MKLQLAIVPLVLAVACKTPSPTLTGASPRVVPASAPSGARATEATAPLRSSAAPGIAELAELAPDFALEDSTGREVRLSSLRGKYVVLEWLSTTCPYSVYAHDQGRLKLLPDEVARHGGVWLAIVSKTLGERGSTPAEHDEFARKYGLRAPILRDPTQDVARAYGVERTPQLFVVNEKGLLVYRGALDNAPLGRPDDGETRLDYVETAIMELRDGRAVTRNETVPYGCPVRYAEPAGR